MSEEKEILQDELKRVKFRIEILNMIEVKLREMRDLAGRVVDNNLGKEEIDRIQLRVNELVTEISILEKIEGHEVIN